MANGNIENNLGNMGNITIVNGVSTPSYGINGEPGLREPPCSTNRAKLGYLCTPGLLLIGGYCISSHFIRITCLHPDAPCMEFFCLHVGNCLG